MHLYQKSYFFKLKKLLFFYVAFQKFKIYISKKFPHVLISEKVPVICTTTPIETIYFELYYFLRFHLKTRFKIFTVRNCYTFLN